MKQGFGVVLGQLVATAHGDNTQTPAKVFDKYGKYFNSLRHYSMNEILNNDYFAMILHPLARNYGRRSPKLLACGRTCTDYEFSIWIQQKVNNFMSKAEI